MGGTRTEFAILGGGCAGLSLATALASADPRRRSVRVVEPRTAYRRDRTWCFWDVDAHPFEEAVAHRWTHWRVRHAGRSIERAAAPHRYVEVPGDRFYDVCLSRLSSAPAVDLALGTRMTGVEREDGGFRVDTDAGSFRSRLVFDARAGAALSEADAAKTARGLGDRLWQHFVGQHVRTARPVFDPRAITLMDFDVDASNGIHFVYVLPHSRTEALIESTYLSSRPLPRESYEEDITRYLDERYAVRIATQSRVGP